jgi:hypothetical protein
MIPMTLKQNSNPRLAILKDQALVAVLSTFSTFYLIMGMTEELDRLERIREKLKDESRYYTEGP